MRYRQGSDIISVPSLASLGKHELRSGQAPPRDDEKSPRKAARADEFVVKRPGILDLRLEALNMKSVTRPVRSIEVENPSRKKSPRSPRSFLAPKSPREMPEYAPLDTGGILGSEPCMMS